MAGRGKCAAAGDAMKNRRRTATKTKRPSAPKVSGRSNPSSTNANTKIALLKRERDEALEQQKATAEVLRVRSARSYLLALASDAVTHVLSRWGMAALAHLRKDGSLPETTRRANFGLACCKEAALLAVVVDGANLL